MTRRNPNKLKTSIRQKLTRRKVIIAASSVLILTVAIFTYLQFSQTTSTKAETQSTISPESLPVDFVIPSMVTQTADTNMRNGVRYKVARPLTTQTGI